MEGEIVLPTLFGLITIVTNSLLEIMTPYCLIPSQYYIETTLLFRWVAISFLYFIHFYILSTVSPPSFPPPSSPNPPSSTPQKG